VPQQTETGNGNAVTLQQLLDDLKVVLQHGQEYVKSSAGQVRERTIAGARATDESIRNNPYSSMGIVFGLGLALGLLAHSLFTSTERDWREEREA